MSTFGRPTTPEYRRPLTDEQAEPVAQSLTGRGASGLQYVLSALDKPGRAVRGALGGHPRELLNAVPFSDSLGLTDPKEAVSGRDLLDRQGLTDRHDKGWTPWGAGVGAEMALDPLTYVTFGTGSVLTQAGKAASKAGTLRHLSHADRIGRGLSGLVGVGAPFSTPSLVLGTGARAKAFAGGLDKASDALLYGNKVGRVLGAAFDHRRFDAADRITQKAAVKYMHPAFEAAQADARGRHFGFTKSVDKLLGAGQWPERDALAAARSLAEGMPHPNLDPALATAATEAAGLARGAGLAQRTEARRLGLPLSSLNDEFADYVPRTAMAVPHQGLQPRPGNLFPTTTGANRHRDLLYRDIPGGTEAFDRWAAKHAGFPATDIPVVAAEIRRDMDDTLNAANFAASPPAHQALDQKALDIAGRLSRLDPEYRKLGGFFSPDLAADLARRDAKHARTVASAHGVYGALKDNAKLIGTLPPGAVNVPDLLTALGFRTLPGSKKTGTAAQGALVRAAESLGVDITGMATSHRRIRKALRKYGVTAEDAAALQRAYPGWHAPPTVTEPLKAFDSVTNAFKNMAYSVWPASHARNALSAFTTNTLNGTPLASHGLAFRVMRDTATEPELRRLFPAMPAGLPDAAARDWVRGQAYRDANIFGGHNGATDLAGLPAKLTAGHRITPPVPGRDRAGPTGNFLGDVANLVREGALGSKATAHAPATSPRDIFGQAGVGGGPLDWATGKSAAGPRQVDTWSPLHAGRLAGTNVEDFFRLANYLGSVGKGVDPAEAGRVVNKLHFDYQALAPFEKKVMRRLVPFYTFTRKNLPLQAERLASQPGTIAAQLRPMKPTNDDQFTPEHLASGVAIPLGGEQAGQQRYLSQLGLPAEEAFERLKFRDGMPDPKGTALAYLGSLNPLLKGPLERLFDTQFHTGRRLSDLHPNAFGRTIGNAAGGYLGDDSASLATQVIANTPLTRFASGLDKLLDERKDPLSKAANLLTGFRVTDVDMEKTRAVEVRKALEDLLRRSPHVASYTNFYVRPDEAANLTPEETRRMQMLALLQRNARAAAEAQRAKAAPR